MKIIKDQILIDLLDINGGECIDTDWVWALIYS